MFPFLQIHSLTARSVPRQVRENLRKDLPIMDKNIRLPASTAAVSQNISNISKDSTSTTAPSSDENECHIIYDSQHKDLQVPYPNAEFIRTPSPEHTGIPAGPVKMPPIRSWQSAAANSTTGTGNNSTSGHTGNGYTSDDSNVSAEQLPVKPVRRKTATKQNSNPSVRSLVEKYSC